MTANLARWPNDAVSWLKPCLGSIILLMESVAIGAENGAAFSIVRGVGLVALRPHLLPSRRRAPFVSTLCSASVLR